MALFKAELPPEDRAKLAVLGTMIFAFIEAMDPVAIKKVNDLLVWYRDDDNFIESPDPALDECTKAELDRFIEATRTVLD